MNPHDKRRMAIQQIRNTLEQVAKIDDTMSMSKLIQEIIRVYGVSRRTAVEYIQELIDLGIAKQDGDYLWHSKEKEIRNQYLTDERIKQDSAKDAKIST